MLTFFQEKTKRVTEGLVLFTDGLLIVGEGIEATIALLYSLCYDQGGVEVKNHTTRLKDDGMFVRKDMRRY